MYIALTQDDIKGAQDELAARESELERLVREWGRHRKFAETLHDSLAALQSGGWRGRLDNYFRHV